MSINSTHLQGKAAQGNAKMKRNEQQNKKQQQQQ